MFLSVVIPLRSKPSFPTDEVLINALKESGMEIRRKQEPGKDPGDTVKIKGLDGSDAEVPAGSVWHYRELARLNFSDGAPDHISSEIVAFGLYSCALAGERSNLAVTRINDAELNFWISQSNISRSTSLAYKIVDIIGENKKSRKLVDWRSLHKNANCIKIFSGELGAEVSSGNISNNPLRAFLSDRGIEIVILAISVVALLVTLAIFSIPVGNQGDPLPGWLRHFVEKAWPSLAVSSGLLFSSLLLSLAFNWKRKINWN